MPVDAFRLGVAFVVLALMFPVVDITDKYSGSETAFVTLFLWLIGVAALFASAFQSGGRAAGGV